MQRIRFGVFGLGRGMSFVLQIADREDAEVVAVCEYRPTARERFQNAYPHIRVHDSFDALLEAGLDAVVIASYCPDHAPQAVQALRAGVHVLSEVTAFHTPAQGVELVRTVEQTGLTYMMAENTCYFPVCEEMTRIFSEGQIGEFMYAECEYVHSLHPKWERDFDGTVHWRFWQPNIYYCTHSLGPIFQMTKDRPVFVVGMNTGAKMNPDWPTPRADIGIAFVKMASGAVVKVMAAFAHQREPAGHFYVVYGTKGNMENDRMHQTILHVREVGHPLTDGWVSYEPIRQRMAEQAAKTGHGGADFFVLHDFIDALRTGNKPPIDVYAAADMTLPGILAHRSAVEGGKPFAVPDFRNESVRKQYEDNHWSPKPKIAEKESA